MKRLTVLIIAISSLLQISGCGFSLGSSASPPTDLQITAGDSSVTATWTQASNVQYWLMYAPATSISTSNWTSLPGAKSVINANSPLLVGGLINGQVYSFVMDARVNGGPAGSSSASISVTPRSAGTAWSTGTSLGAMELRGAAFNTGAVAGAIQAVVVGSNGALFSSIDGKSWTAQVNPAPAANLTAARFGNYYMAAGAAGTVLTSPDAITWTKQVSGTTSDLNGIATNSAGQYVAVGANGTLMTTSDGVRWGTAASGTSNSLSGATYGNGRYVAVGANGTLITSTDAVNWQAANPNTSANLNGVAYGAWVVTATGVTVTAFVAVGDAGTMVTSPDGLTWTALAPITTNNLTAIDFGRQFVAVGKSGRILTSVDGTTWLTQTSGTTNDLKAVARGPYSYSAVGVAGTNLYSF